MKIKFKKNKNTIYLLPNLLTTGNFFFGIYSIFLSINGNYSKAAAVLFICMIFDFLDGQAARMQKASSRFGMEYDSLTDLISFGIAPALLTYFYCLRDSTDRTGLTVIFIYSASCALRLARYNAQASIDQKEDQNKPVFYFTGMPSPAAAGFVISFVLVSIKYSLPYSQIALPILTIFLAYLMLSNIIYPKFSRLAILKENHFLAMFSIIAFIGTIVFYPAIFFLSGFSIYTLYGIIKTIKEKLTKKDSTTQITN